MHAMRPKAVAARLGVTRMTLWRWVRAEKFPEPTRLTSRVVVWDDSEVEKWLKARKEVQHGRRENATKTG